MSLLRPIVEDHQNHMLPLKSQLFKNQKPQLPKSFSKNLIQIREDHTICNYISHLNEQKTS
jgi:hypothetical protein